MTRIIGALRGVGLHELMFLKPHPDVDSVPAGAITNVPDNIRLPLFQEMMLDAALDSEVITEELMPFWRAVMLS